MTTDADTVRVNVRLPKGLLADIDAYAVEHGYETPDAVVREALRRQ